MEGRLRVAGAMAPWATDRRTRLAIAWLAAAAIGAIVLAKFALAWRININWDEFLFLSRVHELVRGELSLLLQGAYTHLFRWLTDDGDEIRQVVEARLLMGLLLGLSAWILYRVVRPWASQPASAVAILAFLSSWPVMKHGASFRADSMLLPLALASLAFLARPGPSRSRDHILAGLCFGLAFVVTVKAVLSLPLLLLVATLPDSSLRRGATTGAVAMAGRIGRFFAAAGVSAAALIAAHATQLVPGADQATSPAVRAAGAALFDVPLAPRGMLFLDLVSADLPFWIAMAAGLVVAVRRRDFAAAAAVLAILPVLFYRNAFAYYYPVMMAPATILVAAALERLLQWPRHGGNQGLGLLALVAVCALLAFRAWDGFMALRFDGQAQQRAVVAAVHRVFPAPVPYIDHSGMIASFPKVNFFMSTWGVEAYLRRREDFMPAVLSGACPPLLLANHPVLIDGTLLNRQLRAKDRQLLGERYVDYWGPIRVAGAELTLGPGTSAALSVPCSGRYRVESASPVMIDGIVRRGAEVVDLPGSREVAVVATAPDGQHLRLVWAGAGDPPAEPPPVPPPPLYSPL